MHLQTGSRTSTILYWLLTASRSCSNRRAFARARTFVASCERVCMVYGRGAEGAPERPRCPSDYLVVEEGDPQLLLTLLLEDRDVQLFSLLQLFVTVCVHPVQRLPVALAVHLGPGRLSTINHLMSAWQLRRSFVAPALLLQAPDTSTCVL